MKDYSFDCSLYLPRAASDTNVSFSLIKEIQSTALGTVKFTCLVLPPLPLLTFLAIIRPNVSNSLRREETLRVVRGSILTRIQASAYVR